MDNRFGIKDFILFTVLALIIVMIGLAMLQFDRQWDDVQSIKSKLDQQAADLRQIQQQLAHGIVASATTGPSTQTGGRPAAQLRIQAARDLPNFAQGDWLIYGLMGNIASLTPMIGGDANSSDIIDNVQEALCNRDPVSLELQGLIAQSWTTEDNTAAWDKFAAEGKKTAVTEAEIQKESDYPGPEDAAAQKRFVARRLSEGRNDEDIGNDPACPPAATYTFKLRPNASFSDGVPLTADDVLFTYQFIMNPAVNAPRNRAYLSRIREVKKIGDHEVAFMFRVPYFDALNLAAGFQIMPKHFYEKFTPEQYNTSTGLLMGSGPYMMDDPEGWKPGTQVALTRNPRYWGVQAGFDKLVYREFTNQVALETSFRNGEIDQMGCPPERYVKLLKDQNILDRTQHFEYQSAVGGYRFIAWNQERHGKPTIFADKRVRQAMTLITDTQRILNEINLGYGVLATGPFNPQSKQNDKSLKPWPYDPDRAAKLLADAGWADATKAGVLKNAGQDFTFKLTYPSGNPSTEKIVLLLKDLYARQNIRMEPDPQEWSVFKTRLENHEFDAIMLGWTAGIEDDLFQIFHSSQIAGGGDDFVSYRNPDLDKAIETARRTIDPAPRMELWHKCHQFIYDDQPYTFLMYPKSLLFMDKRIANVQVVPLGLNGDSEWFVPKANQRWTK